MDGGGKRLKIELSKFFNRYVRLRFKPANLFKKIALDTGLA
jgi:hypothetical protein